MGFLTGMISGTWSEVLESLVGVAGGVCGGRGQAVLSRRLRHQCGGRGVDTVATSGYKPGYKLANF
jgi:hypothetical protein